MTACRAGEIIDVARLVDDARSDNDNDSIGLDADALSAVVGIGTALERPSGRFYVNRIGGVGGINLHRPDADRPGAEPGRSRDGAARSASKPPRRHDTAELVTNSLLAPVRTSRACPFKGRGQT